MNIYKPELTIITPVYKVEEYIEKCLDSIISQTFTDWELIRGRSACCKRGKSGTGEGQYGLAGA